jgi:predicted TIM-barrel enzyme
VALLRVAPAVVRVVDRVVDRVVVPVGVQMVDLVASCSLAHSSSALAPRWLLMIGAAHDASFTPPSHREQ